MSMKLLSVLKHPVTQFNLIVLGSLGLIQIIHTHAHYKMEMDVHAYCKQNAEWVESQSTEY